MLHRLFFRLLYDLFENKVRVIMGVKITCSAVRKQDIQPYFFFYLQYKTLQTKQMSHWISSGWCHIYCLLPATCSRVRAGKPWITVKFKTFSWHVVKCILSGLNFTWLRQYRVSSVWSGWFTETLGNGKYLCFPFSLCTCLKRA